MKKQLIQIMNKRESNLRDVLSVQTTSYDVKRMNSYIKKFVKDIPDCKIFKDHGNLYVTRGQADVYPCVVSHTDTVHDIEREFHVQKHNDVFYAINGKYERVGVGGDDKVGVFVALEILRTTPECKVAFFRDEEVGCVGSKLANMKFFKDVSFVLQCDRQGYDDFVNEIFYNQLYPDDFSEAIKPLLREYGRMESTGGMTDVWQLAENGLDVACANMSCGYYDPHSDNEFVVISEVMSTLDLVKEIVDSLGHKRWEIDPNSRDKYIYKSNSRHEYSKSSYRRYGGYGDWYVDDDGYDVPTKETNKELKSSMSSVSDYLVPEAECTCCGSGEQIWYDDTVNMYWCCGCQDYKDDTDINFTSLNGDDDKEGSENPEDDFISHLNRYQEDIGDKLK